MSGLTRRSFIGTAAAAVGSFAYVENTGDTDLVFLEMFGKVDRFQDLSFSEWLAHTPPEAVMAHLNIDKATFAAIPKNGGVIMPLS